MDMAPAWVHGFIMGTLTSPKGTVILSVILPHYQAFYAGLADLYRSCAEGKTGSITMIQYGGTQGDGGGGGSSFGSS
ncbi:hypothetical protein CFAEC_05665 [Corynebacterium faecale]|nr:hypothetical protein CFAEC_05665 [Corynebacterium faecale]